MVIKSHAVSLQDELLPTNRIQSSLAHNPKASAVAALDEAREMPTGDGRTEVIHKATVFRNAAEIHELLCGNRSAPAE